MTEQELINAIARAQDGAGYFDTVAIRIAMVDHLREQGMRLAAEKLESAMQLLDSHHDFVRDEDAE